MPVSLKTFLVHREVDGLSLHESEPSVVEKMGAPESWEGQPKLSREQSAIWTYGDLQITFDDDRRVVKIATYFESRSGSPSKKKPFNNNEFGPETTVTEFISYLTVNDIAFNRQTGEFGETVIQVMDGAAITFKHKVDFEMSREEERRVRSKDELLTSIVAGNAV